MADLDAKPCVADLDAKPCVADLDAHRFCKGYNKPLAMMGVALDRYLPGRNTMLATSPMYYDFLTSLINEKIIRHTLRSILARSSICAIVLLHCAIFP